MGRHCRDHSAHGIAEQDGGLTHHCVEKAIQKYCVGIDAGVSPTGRGESESGEVKGVHARARRQRRCDPAPSSGASRPDRERARWAALRWGPPKSIQ